MSGRVNPVRNFISNGVNLKIWLVLPVIILGLIDIATAIERHVPSQYSTIQAAIDAAVHGDTVIIAPGTYTGNGNRDIDFKGKAITVRSQNGPETCIIDCKGSQTEPHRGFYFHSSEGPSSVLAGLTITKGYAGYGGGIYNSNSSPAVEVCTFSNNLAGYGGGMFNYKSSPTVEGCTFTTNLAKDWGGGMFNWDSSPTVKNCTFSGNSADDGGGGMYNYQYSRPTVKGCTFTDNSATLGGGMHNDQNSSPTIEGCAFTGNSAIAGGGMRNDSSPMVEGCIFSANSASNGGGMDNHESSPMVEGCTFSDNLAQYGGGMNNWLSNPTVDGCTFTINSAQYSGGGMCNDSSSPTVTNCILWGNTAPTGAQIYNYGTSSPAISYCDVQSGWTGTGNINADPCFVEPDSNDYHLQPDSPCINAGDPKYVAGPNKTDIDGELRVMLGRVDMGADEFNPFEVTFSVAGRKRIGRTIFEYECNATLRNISLFTVRNVQLGIVKASENMVIIDPNVAFGTVEIGPGESAISIDTCTFQVDRSEAIEQAKIIWKSTCAITNGGQEIQDTASGTSFLRLENNTGDSKVGFEDLAKLAGRWLWVGPAGSIPEDITGDGIVNLRDFAELAATPQ